MLPSREGSIVVAKLGVANTAKERPATSNETGNTLCAICLYCDKPITGTPLETEFWVYGETSFCNKECFNNEGKETGDMLEQQELDEIYGDGAK
jgi:hypothetical protein